MHVVIAEDRADIRSLIQITLESLEGIKVLEVRDGSAALMLANLVKPALVILDVTLPVMDGYLVCQEIKRSDKLRDTKVIILSARAQAEDVERGKKVGCDVFMPKPFSPAKLLAAVEDCLSSVKN